MNRNIPYPSKLNRWSSHYQIAEMMRGLSEGAHVLDVGAGSGILALMCKDMNFNIRGIEPNASWLGDTRNLYSEIYEGCVEQTPDVFIEGHSAVVCADVLEHLVNPEEQLLRVVNLQPEDSIFIISVPNIANIWIRLMLLFGHFDYCDRGILDRTHLRFFTRNSFINLLEKSGLSIRKLRVTPIPLDLVNPFFSNNSWGSRLFTLFARITNLWPTLFGYQWIAKAKKTNFM